MPNQFDVFAFYKFIAVKDKESVKQEMDKFLDSLSVCGTILVANEGVNGTIAGTEEQMTQTLQKLAELTGTDFIPFKKSHADAKPFNRMKVRLKNEIVTIGDPSVDPNKMVGEYVDPEEWNDLICQDDVINIDTRNDYEVEIGTFKNAIDPHTKSFREFPDYVKQNLDPKKHKRVAMFCTGGIRCEKASSYMLQQGFEKVYHLNGGILKYLECMPAEKSLWDGDCFVFDGRVSVKHGLELGSYDMCFACRHPLTDEEKASAHYIKGISCPKCFDKTDNEQKKRFTERQKQLELAKERGKLHG